MVGVVYDPCADEMFAAELDQGATLNGKAMKASTAVGVANGLVSIGYSNRVKPEDTLGPLERLIKADGMFHRSGSGALSLAYVAAGRLLGYFEPHMNIWDCAAGALLIQESGGRANNILAGDNYLVEGNPVIAAAAGVYEKLIQIINNN